jgi:hypothetical protein
MEAVGLPKVKNICCCLITFSRMVFPKFRKYQSAAEGSVRVRNFSVGRVRSQSADSEKSADLRPLSAHHCRTLIIS